MRRPKKPQRYNWFVITLCSPTMKTIGPQKEWLGTYRFNPRCVFPVAVIRMQRTGLEPNRKLWLFLGANLGLCRPCWDHVELRLAKNGVFFLRPEWRGHVGPALGLCWYVPVGLIFILFAFTLLAQHKLWTWFQNQGAWEIHQIYNIQPRAHLYT